MLLLGLQEAGKMHNLSRWKKIRAVAISRADFVHPKLKGVSEWLVQDKVLQL